MIINCHEIILERHLEMLGILLPEILIDLIGDIRFNLD